MEMYFSDVHRDESILVQESASLQGTGPTFIFQGSPLDEGRSLLDSCAQQVMMSNRNMNQIKLIKKYYIFTVEIIHDVICAVASTQ